MNWGQAMNKLGTIGSKFTLDGNGFSNEVNKFSDSAHIPHTKMLTLLTTIVNKICSFLSKKIGFYAVCTSTIITTTTLNKKLITINRGMNL